jgi:hypothetical protein
MPSAHSGSQADGLFVRLHLRRVTFSKPICGGELLLHPQATFLDYFVRNGQEFVVNAARYAQRMAHAWSLGAEVQMFWSDPDEPGGGDYYSGKVSKVKNGWCAGSAGAVVTGAEEERSPWESVWVDWDEYPGDSCWVCPWELTHADDALAEAAAATPPSACLQAAAEIFVPGGPGARGVPRDAVVIGKQVWRVRKEGAIKQAGRAASLGEVRGGGVGGCAEAAIDPRSGVVVGGAVWSARPAARTFGIRWRPPGWHAAQEAKRMRSQSAGGRGEINGTPSPARKRPKGGGGLRAVKGSPVQSRGRRRSHENGAAFAELSPLHFGSSLDGDRGMPLRGLKREAALLSSDWEAQRAGDKAGAAGANWIMQSGIRAKRGASSGGDEWKQSLKNVVMGQAPDGAFFSVIPPTKPAAAGPRAAPTFSGSAGNGFLSPPRRRKSAGGGGAASGVPVSLSPGDIITGGVEAKSVGSAATMTVCYFDHNHCFVQPRHHHLPHCCVNAWTQTPSSVDRLQCRRSSALLTTTPFSYRSHASGCGTQSTVISAATAAAD